MAKDLSAQLSITAEASGVEAGVGRAKKSLADLGATAATAGKQASGGLQQIGEGGESASKKVDAATRSMIQSIQRTTAALDAGGRSSSKYFELLASQRGVSTEALKPYLTQLDAVTAKQGAAGVALGNGAKQLNAYGLSAAQTAQALRQVPAQLTDIFTGLASGQAPLTVLIQQGGQLKDVFGGIAPAARALGGALLRLINPFTIAASVAIALGAAYNAGSKEADAYARAIIFSGNAAGTTIGNLQSMAKSISQVAGTQGNAAEALALFAASGDVASRSLQRVALAAIQLERAGGQAVAKTVEQFSALAKDPLTASIKLNESTRFLTLSVYQQIKALEEQGKTVEAATVAQEAYAKAIEGRSGEVIARLGSIERAWLAIKDATKGAIDAALNIGRIDTAQEKLADAQKRLADLQARGALGARGGRRQSTTDAEIAAEQATIATLSRRLLIEGEIATAAKVANDQVQARIAFDATAKRNLVEKADLLKKEIALIREQGAAAGASQKEIDAAIKGARERFKTTGPKGPKADDTGNADLASQIAITKNLLDQEVNAYKNAESLLEASRSAGLVSEKEYYAAKLQFIELNKIAQENALIDQIAALEIENIRIKGQKGKETERVNNLKAIADAESKLATIQADAASRVAILTVQQEAAVKRLGLAYLSARQAAQDYFDQTERQQQRDLDSFGQGTRQRQFNSGVNQIEDRFAGQRRDLENQKAQLEFEGRFTDEARKQYEQRLSIINEFQQKSLDSFTAYYDKLLKKQGDFNVGANEALANYIDGIANVAKDVESIFSKTLGGLEDTLTDFVTTGKGSFKDLAQSISADINRLIIRQQITGPLAESIKGGFKSGEGLGGAIQGFFGRILPGQGGADAGVAGAQAAATAAITTAQASSAASIAAATTASATAISTAVASSGTATVTAISASSVSEATTIVSAIGASTTAIVSAISAGGGGASGIASSIGSLIGGGGGDFGFTELGFAAGGRPPVGRPSIVGENGMEVFVPDTPGRILSAADTKAALANSGTVERRPINVTVQQSFAPGTSRQTVDQAAAAAGRRVREQLARATA
jgi:lambda family phage tail tape measure protein